MRQPITSEASPVGLRRGNDVRYGSKAERARLEQMSSALPPKADIDWHPIDVRLVPKADIAQNGTLARPRSDRAIKSLPSPPSSPPTLSLGPLLML